MKKNYQEPVCRLVNTRLRCNLAEGTIDLHNGEGEGDDLAKDDGSVDIW